MYDPLIAKRKQYVTVTAMHYVNGFTCPQILETEDGAFLIEHVKKVQKLSGRDGTGADERFLIILKDFLHQCEHRTADDEVQVAFTLV